MLHKATPYQNIIITLKIINKIHHNTLNKVGVVDFRQEGDKIVIVITIVIITMVVMVTIIIVIIIIILAITIIIIIIITTIIITIIIIEKDRDLKKGNHGMETKV